MWHSFPQGQARVWWQHEEATLRFIINKIYDVDLKEYAISFKFWINPPSQKQHTANNNKYRYPCKTPLSLRQMGCTHSCDLLLSYLLKRMRCVAGDLFECHMSSHRNTADRTLSIHDTEASHSSPTISDRKFSLERTSRENLSKQACISCRLISLWIRSEMNIFDLAVEGAVLRWTNDNSWLSS